MPQQAAEACIKFIKTDSTDTADIPKLASGKLRGENGAGTGRSRDEWGTFIVPFHPSELNFRTIEGRDEKKQDFQVKEDGSPGGVYACQTGEGGVTLSVKLLFDRSQYKESSVQNEVEGFLAAAGSPQTRGVVFCWGNLDFEGIIEGMSAEYLRFDADGTPTAASMDFSISLKDGEKLAEMTEKDYQALFG